MKAFDSTSLDYWRYFFSYDTLWQFSGLALVVDQEGEIVAWGASQEFSVGGRRVLYASSAGVEPSYQGSGLSSRIWRMLLLSALFDSPLRPLYVTMRVGNPLVYSAWSAGATRKKDVYPRPGSGEIPSHIQAIGNQVAKYLGQKDLYEPDTMVVRNAYGFLNEGLWSRRPSSDWSEIDGWMNHWLGEKDAFVMVVAFSPIKMAMNECQRQIVKKLGLRNKLSSRR
ncbi:hypothetical protein [Salinicola tamaricis]|uniref:hypothetical protein n=1 Tax=Salinicola tamaricis TaxID=1771309 RepID=UPI00101AEB22|nr:hypothetical protein [Salinicola tamaricis]